MSDPVLIIGAGIGGLSAAIHLAAAGRRVVILEQNGTVGGKMGEFRHSGYRWDTGPSLITMRQVYEDLFNVAGRSLDEYIELQPVEPQVRYQFADGLRFDGSQVVARMLEQIEKIEPRDVEGYKRFLAYAARLYRIVSPIFIYDQPPRWNSLLKVSPSDAIRFDGLRTMDRAIRQYVRSPQLQQILGQFATYVGASPFQAPATLNVIAHVELNQGLWYPQGGVYNIARAYARLAQELGVEIHTNCPVTSIDLKDGQVAGVILGNGQYLRSSAVIANIDVATVYERLLPADPVFRKRLGTIYRAGLSCSCFVMLLGVRREHPELAHHNTFFSSDYHREFEEMFHKALPPSEPTIYLSITSKSTPRDAPPGCENWFIQINVPALNSLWDWSDQREAYAERVLNLLARRGFDIRSEIEYCRFLTPHDLERLTGSWRGALYGASSNNRWAAFRRPHNRGFGVGGMYFAGGTTHPGGGVPMVTLSGKVASQLLVQDGY